MPIYEFTCKQCNQKFDHLARTMSGEPKANCPSCGSSRTERELSVFAVGGEGGTKTSSTALPTSGCGRCGGPGPCPSGF